MLVGIVLAVVPNWKFDASSTELAFLGRKTAANATVTVVIC